jgi:hypothetical protein
MEFRIVDTVRLGKGNFRDMTLGDTVLHSLLAYNYPADPSTEAWDLASSWAIYKPSYYQECCLLGCYAILHSHRHENLKSYKLLSFLPPLT